MKHPWHPIPSDHFIPFLHFVTSYTAFFHLLLCQGQVGQVKSRSHCTKFFQGQVNLLKTWINSFMAWLVACCHLLPSQRSLTKNWIEAWCWNRYFLTKNVVFGLHGALSEPKHRTATVKDMLTLMELWLIRTLVRYPPAGRAPWSLKVCFFDV